jgi:GntR family transcriptional regulator
MSSLNRDSEVALYRQLKNWILGELERGAWVAGAPLPSERALVAEFGVSRITVRNALRELVQEGVLRSAPGKGFFVAERPNFALHGLVSLSALAQDRGMMVFSRVLAAHPTTASPALARQMDLDVGAALLHLERVRLLDGVPVSIQALWLPERRCRGLFDEDLERVSLFAVLRERFGITLARAESAISARVADAKERRLLELDQGAPVLTVDQRTLDGDGKPVELSLSAHHPERFPVSLVQEAGGDNQVRTGMAGRTTQKELR